MLAPALALNGFPDYRVAGLRELRKIKVGSRVNPAVDRPSRGMDRASGTTDYLKNGAHIKPILVVVSPGATGWPV
jgi:hypothetical protein